MQQPPEPAPLAKLVVLVVEDNDGVRDVAVALVEEMGYEVLDAASGSEALKLLCERNDISLLLSDVVMAGMNGPELAVEALKLKPDLKVLFASGFAGDTLEEVHDLPQFIDLINKPFTREELTLKVRKAVGEAIAA
jgi:CheY-like chemotaxis protein